uniref:Beta-microseminoprotein n=1 Tax=Esox lucius TaxID=8010 RepID=A0AAY5KEH8_ESOLU
MARYPGSRWRTSDCMDCSCLDNGEMRCCQARFTQAYEVVCEQNNVQSMLEFDQKSCQYNVFKKSDRSIPCPIYGSVGK